MYFLFGPCLSAGAFYGAIMAVNLRNRSFLKLLDFTPEEIKALRHAAKMPQRLLFQQPVQFSVERRNRVSKVIVV